MEPGKAGSEGRLGPGYYGIQVRLLGVVYGGRLVVSSQLVLRNVCNGKIRGTSYDWTKLDGPQCFRCYFTREMHGGAHCKMTRVGIRVIRRIIVEDNPQP